MGWAVSLLVLPIALTVLVIALSAALINRRIQMRKVTAQLQAILSGKTQKMVTVALLDKQLERLAEAVNEIALKESNHLSEIQKREEALKENIASLSHDLRTPLTSIRGYLKLLEDAPAEKRSEYIKALTKKAYRLERLIDDFYQISLLDGGNYPLNMEKIELCSLVTETLLDNHPLFVEAGISPQVDMPDKDLYIQADRVACVRIVQNLLFNALSATSGSVAIQLQECNEGVRLSIANSIAVAPSEAPEKLFQRFYTADQSRSAGHSGQGLYIVKKLLLQMGCEAPEISTADGSFTITVIWSHSDLSRQD